MAAAWLIHEDPTDKADTLVFLMGSFVLFEKGVVKLK